MGNRKAPTPPPEQPVNSRYAKAFWTWEHEFRMSPEKFMTADEIAASEELPLAEQRAVYFASILRSLEQR